MVRLRFLLLFVVLSAAAVVPNQARAQFRNNGIYLPQMGYMSLELFGLNNFGSTDAGFFGVGGMNSIGYNFWVTYRLWVGFSAPTGDTQPDEATLLTTLSIIPGIRYNFLDEEIRPYGEFGFQYLWFLYPVTGLRTIQALGEQAMYGAPRLAFGLEWYFYEEMSLTAEVAGNVFLTIGTLAEPGFSGLVGYTVYY